MILDSNKYITAAHVRMHCIFETVARFVDTEGFLIREAF